MQDIQRNIIDHRLQMDERGDYIGPLRIGVQNPQKGRMCLFKALTFRYNTYNSGGKENCTVTGEMENKRKNKPEEVRVSKHITAKICSMI